MDRRWARRAPCPRAQRYPRSARALKGRGSCRGGSPGIHAGEDVPIDPDSNFIILEQLAQARDHVSWNDAMAPALAKFNCRVIQSTSDEAPGLLAYVEHSLEVHHSPDLFHVQHELVKAVSGPMATKERAAHKAVIEAQEPLQRLQTHPISTGEAPDKHGPGRPSK